MKNFSDPNSTFQIRLVKFNGKPHIDARKYYNNSNIPGEFDMKPMNKGIALNAENFEKMINVLEESHDEIEWKKIAGFRDILIQ